MNSSPTVTMRFSQAIVQAAERLGIGLQPALLDKLRSCQARVPISIQDELWQVIHRAQPDPLIGLRMGLEIQVGHLDSAGLLLMSSDTLGDALEALIEYFPIITGGSRLEAVEECDGMRLRYVPGYAVLQDIRVEAVIGCFVHLTRWMTGGHPALVEVTLCHSAKAEPCRYQQLIGCPVRFQSPHYSLLYARSALATPLIQANAALREQLQRVANEMLTSLAAQGLGAQVEALVRRHPRWGKERIAEQLSISGRHLTRLLAEEGTSFRLLRDATLHRMATERLRRNGRLHDIALDLGFSDESAFAKAFRRWAGITPTQFREQGRH